jgi:hypothetical protein
MIRKTLILAALTAIYVAYRRSRRNRPAAGPDQEEEAQWANEGGANAPASV